MHSSWLKRERVEVSSWKWTALWSQWNTSSGLDSIFSQLVRLAAGLPVSYWWAAKAIRCLKLVISLLNRLLGMPAAPLFAEDCKSNDICELFIGNQCWSCNLYKISHYFSSLRHILRDSYASACSWFPTWGQGWPMCFDFCLLSSCILNYFCYSVLYLCWRLSPGHAGYKKLKSAEISRGQQTALGLHS